MCYLYDIKSKDVWFVSQNIVDLRHGNYHITRVKAVIKEQIQYVSNYI